jgi:hypothetical protein
MDLVALERVGHKWQIVFWEAKLVDDPRLRCKGNDISPKVVEQLAQYTSWLGQPNHRDLVANAYQNTCGLLVKFRGLAKHVNPEIEELGPGIVAAAAAAADPPTLDVDVKPRLLIYNNPKKTSAFTPKDLQKLRDHKIHVQMVSERDDVMVLEHL